jgi:hypothetical protein
MFTAGLGDPLRTDVKLVTPPDLQTAMSLARAYERRTTTTNIVSRPTTSTASQSSTVSAASSIQVTSTSRPRFRRLSPKEMATKQANECYYCLEKFSNDHKCKAKGVFLLELDDDIEPEAVVDDLGIFLHALTGINVTNMMKLQVIVVGQALMALVDTGSTHVRPGRSGNPPRVAGNTSPRADC